MASVIQPQSPVVLSQEAVAFVDGLAAQFTGAVDALLARRAERQRQFDSGTLPDFLPETRSIRESDWRIGPIPPDLLDRRVEITGPTERKMVINALNSGANVFMADCEDSLCPTWDNLIEGQQNLIEAVRRTISFASPEESSTGSTSGRPCCWCGRADGTCRRSTGCATASQCPAR